MLKKEKLTGINIQELKDSNLYIPKFGESFLNINNRPNPILKYIINIALSESITEIKGCFYRVSQKQLKTFEQMQKRKLLPDVMDLVLSDSIPQMVKGTFNYLNENKNFNVCYINTHAKYAVVKTKEGNNYFINSSGNSNPDEKIEQTSIYNDSKIYKDVSAFLSRCINKEIVA